MEAVIPALLVPGTHPSRTPLRLPQCDATQLKAPSSFRADLLTKYCVVLISIISFLVELVFSHRDMQDNEHAWGCGAAIAADLRGGDASSHGRLPGGSGDRCEMVGGCRSRGHRALWCWLFAGFISMIGMSAFLESTVTSMPELCMPECTSRAFTPPHKTTPTKRAHPDLGHTLL